MEKITFPGKSFLRKQVIRSRLFIRNSSFEIRHSVAKGDSGQILIAALGLISLILLLTLFVLTLSHRTLAQSVRSTQVQQARSLAEAGLDRALEQLARDSSWAGEADTPLGAGTFTVSVAEVDPPDPERKRITATGAVPARVAGATQVTLAIEATGSGSGGNVSFNFAVQAGIGGIQMHNGSRIRGNVWSNGPITGASSAQNQIITGGANAGGANGLIDRVFAYGSMAAHQITRAITSSDATADILENTQFRTGTGYWEDRQSGNQGPLVHTTVTPPAEQNLPVSDETVAEIRESFASTPTFAGDYSVPGYVPTTLGPLVITGNLDLATGANLTLAGNVRVLGNITLGNSAAIQADPTMYSGGQQAAILMTEGSLTAGQGSRFIGSVTVLGLAAGGNIDLMNSVRGDNILFAASPHGTTDLREGAVVRQISAQTIVLRNSAEIPTFPSMIELTYGGSGGGTWRFAPGTWREVSP